MPQDRTMQKPAPMQKPARSKGEKRLAVGDCSSKKLPNVACCLSICPYCVRASATDASRTGLNVCIQTFHKLH